MNKYSSPDSDAVRWLSAVLITVAATTLVIAGGAALAVFGFSAIALGGALMLLAIGATVWRTAALPLAVVATALAASAAVGQGQNGRIDASTGLLIARPADSTAAEAEAYVRGLGSVLVDLRETQLRAVGPTRIRARSDAGRIVVALPRHRCVNLRVRATRLNPDTLGSSYRSVVAAATKADVHPLGETAATQTKFYNPHYGPLSLYEQERKMGDGSLRPLRSGAIIYSHMLGVGRKQTVELVRRTTDPLAPWVTLDLTAAGEIFVRDYPAGRKGLGNPGSSDGMGHGPNGGLDDLELHEYPWYGAPTDGALAGAGWPATSLIDPPPSGPEWQERRRQGTASAIYRAQLAAGVCATREDRASRWAVVPKGPLRGRRVNGLGELVPTLSEREQRS